MRNVVEVSLERGTVDSFRVFVQKRINTIIVAFATLLSIFAFFYFLNNGLGLAYNDARSHLDISRRVVEGLKPGLAQLGSVWLPLPHFLMIPFVANDILWHSGFAGAVISMASFVATVFFLLKILDLFKAGIVAKIVAALVFVLNLNALYLQSTAMTELLLMATMSAASYFVILWTKDRRLTALIWCAFFVMLSTLVRYDGWFLLPMTAAVVAAISFKSFGKKSMEGFAVLFLTLASFGVVLWFLWNLLIFGDPFYFAFGPYSARAQQAQVEAAGQLSTKGDLVTSVKTYYYAMVYNIGFVPMILGATGVAVAFFDPKRNWKLLLALSTILAPVIFNVIALFMGHSVLFVPEIAGDTWFNVRYGIVALPAAAVFIGILVARAKYLRIIIIGLLIFVGIFSWRNMDAVTIDDARVGSSQKNVSQVAGWLNQNAKGNDDLVLIAAASHDAIIFSSGLQMKRFIHEGTGTYWESATDAPDRWARYIVMRTNDLNDGTFKELAGNDALSKYDLVVKGDFADIYELKEEFRGGLPQVPLETLRK